MPKYSLKLTCPTTATHAERTTATLIASKGIISEVTVLWSYGSNLLNALVVNYKKGQIIPSEGGGEIRGDGRPETWSEYIELDDTHPKLDVEVWNEGNDYEQDVYLSIVVTPEMPKWAQVISDLVSILRRVIGI